MNKDIQLAPKNICTGCTACFEICPNSAISMTNDKNGFAYPIIIEDLCIGCGICEKTCPSVNVSEQYSDSLRNETFAAVSKDYKDYITSSSGGIFSLIAKEVLREKGIVYGCVLNDNFTASHIRVDSIDQLESLKGSKYIQSDIYGVFPSVRQDLLDNKTVLFSGTPCQVNGLKHFLGPNTEGLITIDLVCHGVASPAFFKRYIDWFEEKYNVDVLRYSFRDTKRKEMACVSRIDYRSKNKYSKEKSLKSYYHPKFYFYYLYMIGAIYRESCYDCPCLPNQRLSDITLGDYWGIEEVTQLFDDCGGVSVILAHTDLGMDYLNRINISCIETSYSEAIKHNNSIVNSLSCSFRDETVLELDSLNESEKIYKYVKKDIGKKQSLYTLKHMFPLKLKRKVRKVLRMLFAIIEG